MKYLYLDLKKDCKSCKGSGLTYWGGNECNRCLKEIDVPQSVIDQIQKQKNK